MQENKKKLELLPLLQSKEPQQVLKSIDKIKASGDTKYIPFLIEKLNSEFNNEVGKNILALLHTIKDEKAVFYYAEALKGGNSKNIQKELLQFCWENGFNLSNYGNVFANLVLTEEYETAIEAFTVLEENIHNFDDSQKKEITTSLKENLGDLDESKKALVAELIKLFK